MAKFDIDTNTWTVENIAEPVFGALTGPGRVGHIHSPELCKDRPCVVHHPSDHHMIDWPIIFRLDRMLSERVCSHGIGHPDPDDLWFHINILKDDVAGVHGCDGCCAKGD